ncbi:hypothetical protein FI667_g610, partial [Globisporangium splendens]
MSNALSSRKALDSALSGFDVTVGSRGNHKRPQGDSNHAPSALTSYSYNSLLPSANRNSSVTTYLAAPIPKAYHLAILYCFHFPLSLQVFVTNGVQHVVFMNLRLEWRNLVDARLDIRRDLVSECIRLEVLFELTNARGAEHRHRHVAVGRTLRDGNCASEQPSSSAMTLSSSAVMFQPSVFGKNFLNGAFSKRVPFGMPLPYFPVRIPEQSGDHVVSGTAADDIGAHHEVFTSPDAILDARLDRLSHESFSALDEDDEFACEQQHEHVLNEPQSCWIISDASEWPQHNIATVVRIHLQICELKCTTRQVHFVAFREPIMGNRSSKQQPVVDVTLVPQTKLLVAPDECIPAVFVTTKLRVERVGDDLKVFDKDTGEMLFRYDDKSSENWVERFLVDAKDHPIVMMEKTLEYHKNYLIKTPVSPHQMLFKIDSSTFNFIVSMKLKFSDWRTDEKLTLEVDGDWRFRKVVVWLARSSVKKQRDPVCNIAFNDGGYDVDVATGVDLTLIALFCIILNETVDRSSSAQEVYVTHGPPTPKPKIGHAGKEPTQYIRYEPIVPKRLRDPRTPRFLFFEEVVAPLFRVRDILSDLTADKFEINQSAASSAPGTESISVSSAHNLTFAPSLGGSDAGLSMERPSEFGLELESGSDSELGFGFNLTHEVHRSRLPGILVHISRLRHHQERNAIHIPTA